jgi:prepilin-type N-terminal cleavage/methylation domain-containing protein
MTRDKGQGVSGQDSEEGGFTLIETIITLVVLSIAAVGVLSVFTVGIRGSSNPLISNQAMQLAQEKMEDAIALRQSGGFNAIVPNAGGAFPAPYAAFSWTRAVVCVTALDVNTSTGAPPCASGYARVTVTVTNALVGNIALDTLVTNH